MLIMLCINALIKGQNRKYITNFGKKILYKIKTLKLLLSSFILFYDINVCDYSSVVSPSQCEGR